MTMLINLETEAQWRKAYPVLASLKPELTLENCLSRREGWLAAGGKFVGVEYDQMIVAVALLFASPNIVRGSEMVIQALVTLPEFRSRGYGVAIFQHAEALGRAQNCDRLVLHSRFDREEAHSFYEDKCGMERRGYAFVRSLKNLDNI